MSNLRFTARVLFLIFLIFVVLPTLFNPVQGQEAIGTTSTPDIVQPEMARVFPRELFCEDIENVEPGPSWLNITIGLSTLSDLQNTLLNISDHYRSNYDNVVGVWRFRLAEREDQAPQAIIACETDNVITALQISLPQVDISETLFLDDLVSALETPDVVTFSSNPPFVVTAFWFEEGIAAEVYTASDDSYEPDPTDPFYGQVEYITFFAYQEATGYTSRWPYNRTRLFNPYLPSPIGTENPFDFDAMIATITAQPSRTPTPTLAATTP